MKKKLLTATTIVALALGTLAGCGGKKEAGGLAGGGNSAETIKIGANLELTGGVAAFGASAFDGAKLAVKEINNAGGILGKKLELVQADNASKGEESTRAVQRLISSDKVVAIVGAATSGNTLAALSVAAEKKVPMITPSGTAAKVTVDERSGKVNDWVFRACFIDPFQGTVMGNFATKDLNAKTAAIYIDTSSDYSKGLAKSFEEQFKKNGGQIVASESYQQKDTDFKAVLTRIKQKNPDVVYVPGYYEEVGKIVKQGRELGITVPFLGGDGWDAPQLAEIAGKDNLNNTFFSNHYAADDKSPEVQSFVDSFKKEYGKTPDGFAILGYDSVNLIAQAIKRAGSTDTVKIKEALASTKDFKAASGTITYNEKHDPVKSAVVIELKDGKQTFKTKVNP
ncbi:ABC transporter substrate-binding protein [Effusibacillus consociatus]|uniref:ABC transporter substrate-binding protein n=1 Tax=Effusibacillus consociatus TaxID=1117041 RepID=A0ABV9Q3Q9_9BACL